MLLNISMNWSRLLFLEVTYDPLSRILKIEKPGKEKIGRVAVCTAGTADIAVAEEAAQVAGYFRNEC